MCFKFLFSEMGSCVCVGNAWQLIGEEKILELCYRRYFGVNRYLFFLPKLFQCKC